MSDTPMNKPSETDWARIDAMSDDEIDTSDIPPLTEEFFKRAKVRMPKRKIAGPCKLTQMCWHGSKPKVRTTNNA